MCGLEKCRALTGKFDLINLIFGFFLHVSDVGFDFYVAIQYAKRGEWWWFAFTLAFVMLPIIITNFMTFSENKTLYEKLVFLPRSLFIVLIRYWKGFRQWKRQNWDINKPCGQRCYWKCTNCLDCKNYRKEKMVSAESADLLAITRYLETMSESAPQWCLQNYVMLRQWYFPWYTVLSTAFSFLSLAWSVTSLEKAEKIHRWIRKDSARKTYATKSLTVFFAWQLSSLLSRLSALVFFAYVFRYYVFIFFGLHITILAIALHVSKKYYGWPRKTNRFSGLLKCISISYCVMFHISGSISRQMFADDFEQCKLVLILYQIALWLENILLSSLAVWHAPAGTKLDKHLKIIVLCFVFAGCVLSAILMTLYYRCFHPSESVQKSDVQPNALHRVKSARIRKVSKNDNVASTVIHNPNTIDMYESEVP